jgi:hypothetical protein
MPCFIRKFTHNKNAITAVLSNLLLMVVAVAAMALATAATYVITTNIRNTMGERVIIEDLWFNNSTSSVDVYLRNVGKVSVQVSAVYINHTSQSFNSPFNLEIGAHNWLNVSYSSWVSSGIYDVDIVTSRGTHIGGYYEAP